MKRAALAGLLALAACGTSGDEDRPERPAAAAAPAGPALPLDELPTQTLTRGQCALVLWSRTTPARRILLAVNQPPSARVQMAGRTLVLARTGTAGEASYGHHPVQTYAGEGVSLTVNAEFDPREGLIGGAAAPTAALTLRDASGAETVIPAAGLLACQN